MLPEFFSREPPQLQAKVEPMCVAVGFQDGRSCADRGIEKHAPHARPGFCRYQRIRGCCHRAAGLILRNGLSDLNEDFFYRSSDVPKHQAVPLADFGQYLPILECAAIEGFVDGPPDLHGVDICGSIQLHLL